MSNWISKAWHAVTDVIEDVALNIIDPLGLYVNDNSWIMDGLDSAWTAFKHLVVPDMRRDREAMVNSSTTARKIVYGRTRVGGQLAYAETTGSKSEHFHVLVIFAGHAIDRYEEIWFDDQKAATVSGGVVTILAPFAGYASIELFDGTQTAACASMVTASATNSHGWTDDHKLLGCAYGYFKLTYAEGVYASGLPNIKAVLRGKRVYDPRTGLTAWSDNPMLCIRDYMLLDTELGGMGCDNDEVASINAPANICDQLVASNTTGGTEKRYTLNGVINLDGTPSSIIGSMLTSCAGTGYYTGSEWRIFAGAPASPVATIDESWLNGGVSFKTGGNKNELINTVKGTFTDSLKYWENTEFPVVKSDTYLAEDADEELTADISLPFTVTASAAQRLAKIQMERSRRGFSMAYPCNMRAFVLDAMDVVAVNNSLLGFSAVPFRVQSWDFGAMSGVNLGLSKEDPAVYDWAAGDIIDATTPATLILPDPAYISPPTAVDATPTIVSLNGGASSRVDLFVYWTGGGPGLLRYQTQYQLTGAGSWLPGPGDTTDTSITIPGLPAGTYNVRVRGINSMGVTSAWAARNSVVVANSDGVALAAVTGFTSAFTGNLIKLSWDSSSEPDRAYYEIRQGSTWATAAVVRTRETSTEWSFRPAGAGSVTYLIKCFDNTGNESTAAASAIATVPAAAPPTAIAPSGVIGGIDLAVTYTTTSDIDYCEVWASTTNDRAAASAIGITRDGRLLHGGLPNAATRYYWARTRNVFGDYSTWYPASATAGVLGASLANPSQLITLLNSQVDSTALTDYLAGKGSFSDLVDTATPAALAGVGQTGVFATKGQMLIQADRQLQLKAGSEDVNTQITLLDNKIQLKASSADLSGQVDILSTAIGLKLNATGTVGAGMLISAPVGGKSTIQFWSDCLQVCMPDGTGVKPFLTTGNVGGVPSFGVAGNMFIDGSVSASKIAVGELIVGTNVTMGPSATIEWANVTSKPTIPTVPSYITSTKITATTIESPTITAASITGGTITGSTIQTASSGERFVVSTSDNKAHLFGNRGDGTVEEIAVIGVGDAGGGVAVATFGSLGAGASNVALAALSNSNPAILGISKSVGAYSSAIKGFNDSSGAGSGASSGVMGISTNGIAVYGAITVGNTTTRYGGWFDCGVGGAILLGGRNSDPASPGEGSVYFNSASKHFYGWNGTAWKQLDN